MFYHINSSDFKILSDDEIGVIKPLCYKKYMTKYGECY